ncbi:hypothetical protein DV738_g2340, partial [Chaetothyriales sp. CBS 135597]
MAFVAGITIISGLFTIFSFSDTYFPHPVDQGSTFKFAAGLDGTRGLTNAGGDLPDVRVWDHNAKFLGISLGGGKVEHGKLAEVKLDHEYQGVYSLFSANGDAVCIAWVSATWGAEQGGQQYMVLGDMGYYCGATWYYSGMFHGAERSQKDEPKCFWIDKNGDQPTTGFQVYWPAFSPEAIRDPQNTEERSPYRKCNDVDFGVRTEPDPSTINYRVPSRVMRRSPAGVSRNMGGRRGHRNKAMESQLVVGDNDGLSARFLCESSTSLGPDLLNVKEGLFCDMGDKRLYPVCGGDLQADCFDIDSKAIKVTSDENVAGFSAGFDASSRASPRVFEKFYNTTLDWRHNKDARI